MRNETLLAVTKSLRDGKPRTVREIMSRTGLVYNTVKVAIEKIGGLPTPGSWPIQYTLPVDAEVSREALIEGDKYVSIGIIESDEWPSRWDAARKDLGSEIAKLRITAKDKPEELADQFARASRSLASIAYSLQEASGKPDWFTIIGGEIEK